MDEERRGTVDSLYLDFTSRIIAYLKQKIWFMSFHGNLTTGNTILWKRGEIAPPIFHNVFDTSLTSGVKLHIHLSDMSSFGGLRDNKSRLYVLNLNNSAKTEYKYM